MELHCSGWARAWLGFLAAGVACLGAERFEAVEPHMGTLVRIELYADSVAEARQGFRAAFARIAELDWRLSDYKEDSELNAIGLAPRAVSADLLRVLEAAQVIAQETGGAFDVTAGRVIRLWREARRAGRVPTEAEVGEALAHGGFRKLHVQDGRAWVDDAEMRLDLGAIGKGYAADEALAVLQRMGLGRALVAMSGDLAAGDAPPGSEGWRVALPAFAKTVVVANRAVSTSGDESQHWEVDGVRYSHVLDARTGRPLTSGITVSVVAAKGIDADALSTAISIVGEQAGRALARKHAAKLWITEFPRNIH